MTYLLDTQILLWSVFQVRSLSAAARHLLSDAENEFVFSTTSIWEVAIKLAKRPDTFAAQPGVLRSALLDLGYLELGLTSAHAIATTTLPLLHKDPFDRILVAQALVENIPLVNADRQLTQYEAPVVYVG